MPLIKSMENATCVVEYIQTDYGKAKLSLFTHKNGRENPDMILLVSHGWQISPPSTVSEPHIGVPAFAFMVPLGTSLTRTRYDDVALSAAHTFSSAPLAFACSGVPNIIVGAHYIESEDTNYSSALAKALSICDIAVFDDISKDNKQDYVQVAGLSLNSLIHGQPSLRTKYKYFLMHCCRSPWTPTATSSSRNRKSNPCGLFAFDDGFKVLLD